MSLSLPLFFSFCCTRQRRKQRGRASCQVWGLVCSRRLYACPHLCKRGEKKRGKFFIMKGPSPSSSSSPSFLRLDWRVACLLRQLHAQLVGEDSSSSSSLSSSSSSTPLFSLLVGIQLSDSSLLALSSFRLPCTERILRTKPLVPSSFFSSSSLPPSVLEEALRRDLRTLASALPRGLQVLGLLYHNSSSSSSPLLDGRPSGGASLGEGEDVSGSALQLSSSVLSSGLSLLKRCLDRLLQEEGADFCLTLSLPSADRRTDEGRKKSRVIPKEEKEDLVCIGGLPSSLDCEGDQPGEAVPDKDTAFTSPTHAVPWRFSTFVFSSSGNAFSSLSSSSLLKVSVEDALAVLRTEKLVFLRSQLLLEFPFEGEHHEIRRRIEGGARSVSGCARFMEEKNGGSRGSKLKDGEDVPEEEDGKATAEGEDSEDYLVEISSDLGEDILDGLRKQEEAMTGSSRSLFFCMPNGVYVHPSDEGEEEDDESRAEEDKAKKGSSGGKKDKNSLSKGDGDNTLWSAVSTAAKSCGTSVSLSVSSSSCAGQTNPLALPWLTPMENEPKKTCPVPFSFSSLSAVPIPAFLNSVSLLLQSHHAGSPAPDSASSSRSVFSKNNSDSGCMYTTPPRPATCIATCVSSAGAESDSQVTSSLASALAVGIQTQLDVCLFVPGSSSLTSVANELRIAFVSQIRQLAVQVFSSITDEQRPGSGSSFRKKTPALRSTLLSGVSASQATGEAFDLSSSSATSSSDDLSYPSSLPFFPRFLPLFSSSPALKENDRSSSEDGKRTSRTALPSSKETSAAKTRNARSNSYFYQGTGLIGLNFSVVKTLYTCHPLVLGGYVHSRTLRRRWLEILANGRVSPAFRRSASLPWNEAEKFEMKLLNAHASLCGGPKWLKASSSSLVLSLVPGDFFYFHYNQDGEKDEGWGCCYRSIQLVFSWFKLQHHTDKPIPSIKDIQRVLKKNDLAHENIQLGSRTWIGTVEGSYVFNWELHVACKMIYLAHASELSDHSETLHKHFDEVGTPAMMGVGDYAYTMVGVCTDRKTGETAYLIVDPHYPGEDTNGVDKILDKGWIAWKKSEFFEKTAGSRHINISLPQTTTEDGASFV